MQFHGTCPSIICLCNNLNVIHKLDQVWTKISCPPKWWNPPKIYKPESSNKGGKHGTKEKGPRFSQKTKTPNQGGDKEEWQKIKYLPLISKSMSKKERGCTLRKNTYLRKTLISENVGLLTCSMKTNIFHNRCKGIPHGIMGCRLFLATNTTKKVNPHGS